MAGIIPSIAAAPATEQPCEREAGIHAPHSGDGGGTVVDDRPLAAIRRAASKIAEQARAGPGANSYPCCRRDCGIG